MSTFSARVQFLDDTDPFSSTNYPEPSRPPTFTFLTNVHLVNQLSGIHRLLHPPHKVRKLGAQTNGDKRNKKSGNERFMAFISIPAVWL